MGHHAGDTYHYHGLGDARYGHRHAFLSIMHEHDDPDPAPEWDGLPDCVLDDLASGAR